MALSIEEGQAIRTAVHQNGVPYALVHNLLFSVHMRAALAQLAEGGLGQPFFGRAQSLFNRGTPDSLPDMWWTHRAGGGGAILVTAWHEIYAVEALIGSPIRYVEGKVETLLYPMDADDIALLRFEHENGALSVVNTSWCVPVLAAEAGRWCEVHAPGGSLRVHHRREGPLLHYDRATNGWSEVEMAELEHVEGLISSLVGHVGYFAAVFDALAEGRETPVPVEQACHIMAVVEAARRSTAERRAIDVQEIDAP
jgi:predicted dehydrogenase